MSWILALAVLGLIIWRMMPVKGVKTAAADDVKPLLNQKGNQFIDVRTPGEYNGSHLKEFRNIPLNELMKRSAELDKERPVYVICQSGMRSSRAAGLLKKQGFNQVTNIKGGMSAWQ